MNRMNDFGRIAICGLIASYDGGEMTTLSDLRIILVRRLTIRGFIILEFMSDWRQAQAELIGLASSGKLKWRETIAEGIENAPSALLDVLQGRNFGKQLVKLA
jgi:NADPH-dependent curcumin reductase CurA